MANGTLSQDEAAALAALSFEEALSQLEAIVRALEQGNVPLEKASKCTSVETGCGPGATSF